MKTIYIHIKALLILSFLISSCSDLDLSPQDYYGANNFWKNKSQVEGFIYGAHNQLRSHYVTYWLLGEARGGLQKIGTSSIGTSLDNSAPIKNQDLTADNAGVKNWLNLYGKILNLNLAISKIETEIDFLEKEDKNYYLGQLYGMRAWYYFWLYRTFGAVPINKEIKVLNGVTSALPLYLKRNTPKEVLDFIKEDINKSESSFGSNVDIKDKSLWSKYATLMLKGEIYLWSAKVSTGDQEPEANDLNIAEKALQAVENKFELLPNFSDIFDYTKKGNNEIIFALRFLDKESNSSFFGDFRYPTSGNNFMGTKYDKEGKPYQDPLNLKSVGGTLRHEYKFELFNKYNELDQRKKATFLDFYKNEQAEGGAVLLKKYIGYINSEDNRVYADDVPIYRYADVLLLLAEVKNKKGEDPSAYINKIRQRAYGKNYKPASHAYANGSFANNELTILLERDKEFVAENKRWFDIRRMQDASGKPLVFSALVNYGTDIPILDISEKHKLLWPINVELLNNDPELEQTKGY